MQRTQKIVMALSYHLLCFLLIALKTMQLQVKTRETINVSIISYSLLLFTGHLFEASVIYAKYTKMSGAQDFLLS